VGADIEVIVRGGEATVEVTGDGVGGRNTEMALSAALALNSDDEWVIASLASDGDDGNSGAAGAIADASTVVRALDEGIDPMDALRTNDSASVFRAAGGLVVTGPTGTNVNDVYIAVRCRDQEESS
jgi:glycerate-2-kinase